LNADQSLQELSSKGLKELLDAILIYMTVAAGEQSLRCPKSVPVEALGEVVIAVRGDALANRIAKAFGEDARKWSATLSDEETRKLGTGQLAFTVDRATISPGCIEFTTAGGLWLMFKTAWSPARIVPGCGSPAK